MSGEHDRGDTKPGRGPIFDDGRAPRPVGRPRAQRAKPPPGIISAGGVDMARAHASGIVVRAGATPEVAADEPRVVLTVDAELRPLTAAASKVWRREWARSAPGGAGPRGQAAAERGDDPRAAAGPASSGAPAGAGWGALRWAPVGLSVCVLALVLGVVRREERTPQKVALPAPEALTGLGVLEQGELPRPAPGEIAAPFLDDEVAEEGPAPAPAAVGGAATTAAPPASPTPRKAPFRAPRASKASVPAPGPQKPAFIPPFELPAEAGRN